MAIKKVIPFLFGLFALVYLFQTYSFFANYPLAWMGWATILLIAVLSPFVFLWRSNKDSEVNRRFDLNEEERREEREQDEEQIFELKEIWLGSS